jgi:hypothetical protein
MSNPINAVNTATEAVAVTPDDSNDLAKDARALWVGVLGDISVDMLESGESIVFKGVQGLLQFAVKRVNSTGTTATEIVALN